MKLVIQRVISASVMVKSSNRLDIGRGLVVLFGAADGDDGALAVRLAEKTMHLRIFQDENQKMNRSVGDLGLDILVVPNFTLLADTSHGNRPSFIGAADPALAAPLFEAYCDALRDQITRSGHGRLCRGTFGADMLVDIRNDGPVTIVIDTEEWKRSLR